MKKKVLAVVLGMAMVASMMVGCNSKKEESADTYNIAIVKQMDHASIDEIADAIAEELGIPVLGKMPIDAALAEAVESEKFYEISNEYLAAAVNKI